MRSPYTCIIYGIRTRVLDWFKTYLGQRVQQVRFRGCRFAFTALSCSVPQGSVLGPILFLIYTADLIRLIEGTGLRLHLYADDMQIYRFCRPDDTQALTDRTSACIRNVATWIKSNRLQLSSSMTEVLWCAEPKQQHSIPDASIRVCADDIKPAKSVRALGYISTATCQ